MIVQQMWLNCLFAGNDQVLETSIKIIVKDTSLVKGTQVLLGDISKIYANGFLKEALEKIVLGPSPRLGKIKSFDKKRIAYVIQGQRYLPENIILTSPQRIYVKRLGQTILKQDIRQFIEKQLSQDLKNKEYQLTTFNVRGLEPYPQGNLKFRLGSNDYIGNNGKFSFFLDVIIDEKKEDRVSVSGSVAVFENVLHTKKSYKRGETISKENTCQKKKNIFELSDNFIKTFQEIDGKILKASIRKGDYLKTDLLSDPPLVQKGEIITLVAKNENLLIVTSAISKEDGFENGVIRVENLRSGKLVRGIVKGKSKVEVIY